MQEKHANDQDVNTQELATELARLAEDELREMVQLLQDADPASLFGPTEFKMRDLALQIAAKAYQQRLAQKKNGYVGSSVTCPQCRQAAAYHTDRERRVQSILGTLPYQRAYYYCRCCSQGCAPFDQQAGITARRLTPALEQLTTLAGAVCESFERGADVLKEMAGVRLSESTVERTTEDVGVRIEKILGEGKVFGPPMQWQWQQDAQGRTVAYCTIDATGTRQQGANGRAAEGRMAYVAGVYNPPPEGLLPKDQAPPRLQARYISGLYELAQVGPLLRRQGAQVGMDQAQLWIALTDGGNGLEAFAQQNFNRPDLVVILDFYHAASYLQELARVLHPQEEKQAAAQAEQWCRLLKEEGGATTLAVLREWVWPERKSAALRAQWSTVEEYFQKNVHRMEYPEYLAEGWQIGSGVVESACKTVVGQRLKGAGMRWSAAGAHALCHVRALYRSEKGQWESFWRRKIYKGSKVQQLN